MSPKTLKATMFNLTLNSNDSTSLSVPKLHDDRSNWADYEPHIQKAIGSRGLWRHVEGTEIAPTPYLLVNGVPTLADGKIPATEEQIKAYETKMIDFDKHEYLTQHIILSTTSVHLGGCNHKKHTLYSRHRRSAH